MFLNKRDQLLEEKTHTKKINAKVEGNFPKNLWCLGGRECLNERKIVAAYF